MPLFLVLLGGCTPRCYPWWTLTLYADGSVLDLSTDASVAAGAPSITVDAAFDVGDPVQVVVPLESAGDAQWVPPEFTNLRPSSACQTGATLVLTLEPGEDWDAWEPPEPLTVRSDPSRAGAPLVLWDGLSVTSQWSALVLD